MSLIQNILIPGQDVDMLALLGYLEAREVFAVQDPEYGAVGDGVANDTSAIEDAYTDAKAVDGIVAFSHGNYKFTNLVFDGDQTAVIAVGGKVTLTCAGTSGIAITVGKSAATMTDFLMEGFEIIGNADMDGGIAWGTNTGNAELVLWRAILRRVTVRTFLKANAYAIKTQYCVQPEWHNCNFEDSVYGAYVGANCTTLKKDTCAFRTCTTAGYYVETGSLNIVGLNCIYESNYGMGFWRHGGAMDVEIKPHFENNNRTTNGTASKNFQLSIDSGVDGPMHIYSAWFGGGNANSIGDIYIGNVLEGYLKIDGAQTYVISGEDFIYNDPAAPCPNLSKYVTGVVYEGTGNHLDNTGYGPLDVTVTVAAGATAALPAACQEGGTWEVWDTTNNKFAGFEFKAATAAYRRWGETADWSDVNATTTSRNLFFATGSMRIENTEAAPITFRLKRTDSHPSREF